MKKNREIGSYCPEPLSLEFSSDRRKIEVGWECFPEHREYRIAYRPQGAENWHEQRAYSSPAQLLGIRSGMTYECRVDGVCEDGSVSSTSIHTVVLPLEDTSRRHSCGVLPSIDLSNVSPLEVLLAEGAYAWRIVNSYSNLRKQPEILKVVSNLISNEKFHLSGLTLELLEGLIRGNHGAGAEALEKLLSGYETLVASSTKFENIGVMVTELNKGSPFAEGERWIQRHMLELPTEPNRRV